MIPSLLWINFKVRVSTGMSPGLISAQARGRQAAFCTLSFILKGWGGGLAHAGTHTVPPEQNDPGPDVAPDGVTKGLDTSLPQYL